MEEVHTGVTMEYKIEGGRSVEDIKKGDRNIIVGHNA